MLSDLVSLEEKAQAIGESVCESRAPPAAHIVHYRFRALPTQQ